MSTELIIAVIASITTILIASGGGAWRLKGYLDEQERRRLESIASRDLERDKLIKETRDQLWERVQQQHKSDVTEIHRCQDRIAELERQFRECKEDLDRAINRK